MKRFILPVLIIAGVAAHAQDSASIRAKNFIRQGDYSNAIVVLNYAIREDGENIELKKDLAFAYYLTRDYTRALVTARPIVENKNADVQSFQILGLIYKAIEERKEAEKMYRAALKKFPESGPLYNEYGEVLWLRQDQAEAAKQWKKGIQVDPGYSGNYYNAARYYATSADRVWGLIYGEIFVNLESYSKRTPEIKTLLLDGYKKLFSEADISKGQDMKNDFVKAFLETMKSQSAGISAGISPEALSAVRTRFLVEWFDKHASRFPFRLFEHQRQLAEEGMFEAYNQWIFAAAENLSTFQQWTVTHAEEYNRFNNFQRGRVFKVPANQNYQSGR